MDMFDCGIYSFVNAITMSTIKYWAKNSYQHIDVLLDSAEPNKATLEESFRTNMKRLHGSFQAIHDELETVKRDTNVYYMVKRFLRANDHFITLLERLKFEGYNGYPILYQLTYHILYEQMYVKEIFKPLMNSRNVKPQDVVINANFREVGLGTNPIQCIYGQLYFWSIIGAEHPSIIMNISPTEMKQLPKKTIDDFNTMTHLFNKMTYKLSNIYPKLNSRNLVIVLKEFETLNKEFIKLLGELWTNPRYLPTKVKDSLPKLFFGILEHIINEHKYADALCHRILENIYGD